MTESPHNKTDLIWAVAAAGAPSSWGRCRWGAEQHPQAPQVTLSPFVIGSADKQLLRGEIWSYLQLVPVLLEAEGKGELLLGSWLPSQRVLGLFALWLQFPAGIPLHSHRRMPKACTVPRADRDTGEEESTRLGITGNCGNHLSPQSRLQQGPAGHEIPRSPAWLRGAPQ